MRLMTRNLSVIYYCLYEGRTPMTDANGHETGEYTVGYGEPVALRCNVSPATGYAQVEMFGNLESYDKVIITDDMTCPIDENSVLFVDSTPTETQTFDYKVLRVARSLNSISYAVSKVSVSQ